MNAQTTQDQSQADQRFIVHRHANWLFMLDATEYNTTGIAHFMVAFGKETVFHAKYTTDEEGQGHWVFRQQGGELIILQWDTMIIKVKELIDESEGMGLVVAKHQLLTDFDQVFSIDQVLELL
tara:strand:- start:17375 stop:17743 length:369 start_codon:yes stop_codon:yes gene_type:complete